MMRTSSGRVATVFFLANLTAIVASVASGYSRGDLAFRFEENEAVTVLSSIQLGATALLAWMVYLMRERLQIDTRTGDHRFWLICALGFLYLTLDETFQFHEGMDTGVARMVGLGGDPMLDGAATAFYGIAAAALCYWYRGEIFRDRRVFVAFVLGGFFLAITSVLNVGKASPLQIVIEESAKLMGVVCFLLGHLAAFSSTLEEVRPHLQADAAKTPGPTVVEAPRHVIGIAPRR